MLVYSVFKGIFLTLDQDLIFLTLDSIDNSLCSWCPPIKVRLCYGPNIALHQPLDTELRGMCSSFAHHTKLGGAAASLEDREVLGNKV